MDGAERARLRLLVAVFAMLTAGALASSPSFLFSKHLGGTSKLALAAGISCWVAGVVFGLAASLRLSRALAARAGRWRAPVLALLLGGLFVALLFTYVSWLSARYAESFLSPAVVRFFFRDPLHVLSLATPTERLASVVAVVLAALTLTLLVLLTRTADGSGRQAAAPARAAAALAAGAGLFLLGYPALFLDAPQRGQYRRHACYHTTPGLALACGFRGARAAEVTALSLAPIVPVERYVARVDAQRARRTSVVLVVVESQRADSLRLLGGTGEVMPFLDTLAADGLVFSRAYAQSNASNYAVPAIVTSLYPLESDAHNHFTVPSPRIRPWDLLKPLGYRTGVFSSSNDRWGNVVSVLASPSLDELFYPEVWDGDTLVPREDTGFFQRFSEGHFRKGSLDDRVTVSRFLSWLDAAPAGGPFVAYLNLQAAHFPYHVAFEMPTPFAPHAMDFEVSFAAYPREKAGVMRNRYQNSLRYVDDRLREIVESLRARGRDRDTIVVVVGDHGQAFHEHGRVTHAQDMHEEVLRVPAVFWGPPDVVPRRVDDRPFQHVDVIPTLLGLLGLPAHPNHQGRDVLAPTDDPYDHKLFLTTQHLFYQNVLVWRGHKYVMDSRDDDRFYSLVEDPGETRNQIDRHPDTARQYREILLQWCGAQFRYYGDPAYHTRYYPPRME